MLYFGAGNVFSDSASSFRLSKTPETDIYTAPK